MKAKIRIIAMLISMTIGTLAASAQSARGSSHGEKSRSSSSVNEKKKPSARQSHTSTRSSSPKATQSRTPSRSSSKATQSRTVTRSSTPKATSARRTTTQQGSRESSRQPMVAHRSSSRKTSTTTRYNPNSNYRTPNKTVDVSKTYKDPKANRSTGNRTTYGVSHSNKSGKTHHRNYYYPVKKVKIHVHPMTYRSNYRVLYYPRYSEIVWTRSMHRHYIGLYPGYSRWHYNIGYRIQTMSAFDAKFNVGEIAKVYGRVYGTWYNPDTDDLLLFFGGEYPYQEFTMVVPGKVARRYSWRPERYFLGQHVAATGLITSFEGKAEMVIKRKTQIDIY